jgi:hypothetical protein
VKVLNDLKKEFKDVTGEEWKPEGGAAPRSSVGLISDFSFIWLYKSNNLNIDDRPKHPNQQLQQSNQKKPRTRNKLGKCF